MNAAAAKRGKSTTRKNAKPARQPRKSPVVVRERAERVVTSEVDYIHNDEFEDDSLHDDLMAISLEAAGKGKPRMKRPSGLPSYLAGLYEIPLLTAEQERLLFRKMNYLRFQANRLRSSIDPDYAKKSTLDEFDRLVADADRVRNWIARCNLRLVVSIARKFTDRDHPFDDLVSDGNVALLHAIAKFDYGRGFRFSTYATHAIRRAYYRKVQQQKRRRDRMGLAPQEILNEADDPWEQLHLDEKQYGEVCDLIARMSDELDEREQFIVQARFGLIDSGEVQTLQSVAKSLGICKERVRQLQNRALFKVKELASEMQLEKPDYMER
ncbi:MAG: sigma-70 family RNA polymerase sigma factor [Planctomycetota bacterium]